MRSMVEGATMRGPAPLRLASLGTSPARGGEEPSLKQRGRMVRKTSARQVMSSD